MTNQGKIVSWNKWKFKPVQENNCKEANLWGDLTKCLTKTKNKEKIQVLDNRLKYNVSLQWISAILRNMIIKTINSTGQVILSLYFAIKCGC